ncbi:MAG: hypothetical protein NWP79_02805, partial [Paracoccaceae bacterium]|nr:hypothetical protein [Paracoccaceae bacterium]
ALRATVIDCPGDGSIDGVVDDTDLQEWEKFAKATGLSSVYDLNLDGLDLIADIRPIYDNYGFETNILAASIRSANHMSDCAKIGADVATAPPAVIKAMANHILTDKGLDAFMADAKKAGIKIV